MDAECNNGVRERDQTRSNLAERDLREQFHSLAITSRWLLVGSETVQSAFLVREGRVSHVGFSVLLLLLAYNAISLWVAYRTPLQRLPLAILLAADIAFVFAAAGFTGVSRSPFLGQLYLIIFAGSLFFGLRGGVATGAAAAMLTTFLALREPVGLSQDVRDLIPYFLVSGAFTGYLSDRLRASFQRYRDSARRETSLAVERESDRLELELARSIQEAALLPKIGGRHLPGLEISVHRAFSRAVGGDLSLVISDQPPGCESSSCVNRVDLVVGDVSGKGIPAALTANGIVYLLPHLCPLSDFKAALAALNTDLVSRLPDDAFVTLILAEIILPAASDDPAELRVCSAGHPPAVVWRQGQGVAEILGDAGESYTGEPVLGVFGTWGAEGVPAYTFHVGDIVVLYSDGLIETRSALGEQFGVQRVANVIEGCANKTAKCIVESLAGAVSAWGECRDDLTILACRRERAL